MLTMSWPYWAREEKSTEIWTHGQLRAPVQACEATHRRVVLVVDVVFTDVESLAPWTGLCSCAGSMSIILASKC
jgi:hypothetical protein